MRKYLSFDDVLLQPGFSYVRSRKEVETQSLGLNLPIISSNMDSVTGVEMAHAMAEAGAGACLHRFWSIEDNVAAYKASPEKTWVSVGLGDAELDRAEALFDAGAEIFVIDVAHGASAPVREQSVALGEILDSNAGIIVGNFATLQSIRDFIEYKSGCAIYGYKVGIGGGSACSTRVVTGCGVPTFGSVLDCASSGLRIIADGGIRNSGDFAKALAAGASAVMLGKTLAGSDESAAPLYGKFFDWPYPRSETEILKYLKDRINQDPSRAIGTSVEIEMKRFFTPLHKKYRGSASQESYVAQGKTSEWRTPEGESFNVALSGPVKKTLQTFEAGLRSAMSYVGAHDIKSLQTKAQFIEVTPGGAEESKPHGKK